MEPRIIQPAKQLAALLKQHERARGVIDYVIFENIDPAEISIGFHKAAAIDALREIDRRLKRAASQRAFELDEDINAFPRVRLNAEKIKGHKIDKNEFFRPLLCCKRTKTYRQGRY